MHFQNPLLALLSLVFVMACAPAPKSATHPGIARFGRPCDGGECKDGLECVKGNGYGGEDGLCELRCANDENCGDGARCSYAEKAPSTVCRAKASTPLD
ncbi:MAG: hypothetical protein NVS3B20_07120 [Polyangiales bacterium]